MTNSDVDNYINNLKSLENMQVTIGIQGEKGEQKKLVRLFGVNKKLEKGQKREEVDPDLTVSQVAHWLDEGTENNMPKRPVVRWVFREKKDEIWALAKKVMKRPDIFFDVIGNFILKEMKLRIKSKIPPPNSIYTIMRKGSSTPWIDTGQTVTSLTYKVSRRDKS